MTKWNILLWERLWILPFKQFVWYEIIFDRIFTFFDQDAIGHIITHILLGKRFHTIHMKRLKHSISHKTNESIQLFFMVATVDWNLAHLEIGAFSSSPMFW